MRVPNRNIGGFLDAFFCDIMQTGIIRTLIRSESEEKADEFS